MTDYQEQLKEIISFAEENHTVTEILFILYRNRLNRHYLQGILSRAACLEKVFAGKGDLQ